VNRPIHFHRHPAKTVRERLAILESLDRQYGESGVLPVEGADELVASILVELASAEDPGMAIGVALWAMRHGVPIDAPEVVVNALAARSNQARGKEELAAVFALMQGFIAHVAPRLSADLERSNPERAWRIAHLNFALTAIRTEDAQMMDFAFDAMERALPDEAKGFFAEALAHVLGPGISPVVRERLEARVG